MRKRDAKSPWTIVATHTDKPDVEVIRADQIEFHAPGGRSLCRIRALPDGRIEFRCLADQLLVEPVTGNVIYLDVLRAPST